MPSPSQLFLACSLGLTFWTCLRSESTAVFKPYRQLFMCRIKKKKKTTQNWTLVHQTLLHTKPACHKHRLMSAQLTFRVFGFASVLFASVSYRAASPSNSVTSRCPLALIITQLDANWLSSALEATLILDFPILDLIPFIWHPTYNMNTGRVIHFLLWISNQTNRVY